MSAPGLFVVGFLVTLIVAAALALLIYAAILDGRDAAAQKLGVSSKCSQKQIAARCWPRDRTT